MVFSWETEKIEIIASRMREHSDSVWGNLCISTTAAQQPLLLLPQSSFNFSAPLTRGKLAKEMRICFNGIDWDGILKILCHNVVKRVREGEPAHEVWTEEALTPLKFMLYPFVPEGVPTVFFGEGGSGKSTLVKTLGLIAMGAWDDNPFNIPAPNSALHPLVLDWETDEPTFRWELTALVKGNGIAPVSMHYRFCARPLADDLEAIQDIVSTLNPDPLIIDSLGLATGGDLNKTTDPFRFYSALRQLKRTSIIVAHTQKDQDDKPKRAKTIYGNVHFFNYARSVWEVRATQEEGSSELDIGLFHTKANRSQKFTPRAFKLLYSPSGVALKQADIKSIPELVQHMKLGPRIKQALARGLLNRQELAFQLGEKPAQISLCLNRLKKRGEVVLLEGDNWGLPIKSDALSDNE